MTEIPTPAFLGEHDFVLEGIRFRVVLGPDYTVDRTDEAGVVLLKPWPMVRAELEELRDLSVSRMLEFGIWQGGSAVLWSLIWRLERYVGLDKPDRSGLTFPRAVLDHPRWGAVRIRGGVLQDDRESVRRIVKEDFDGPLDLVIDDASHQYQFSKATFETCFPMLRTGGIYLIEDWAWAHTAYWQDPNNAWWDEPALSNLIIRILLLSASRPDIIPRIVVRPSFVLVHRGAADISTAFSLDDLIVSRGRQIGEDLIVGTLTLPSDTYTSSRGSWILVRNP